MGVWGNQFKPRTVLESEAICIILSIL